MDSTNVKEIQAEITKLQADADALKKKIYKQDGNLRANAQPQHVQRFEEIEEKIETLKASLETTNEVAEAGDDADSGDQAEGQDAGDPLAEEQAGSDETEETTDEQVESEEAVNAEPSTVEELAAEVAKLRDEMDVLQKLLKQQGIIRPRKFIDQLKKQGQKKQNEKSRT